MKEFVRNMNGAERKAWRVWRACWFGIYAVVTAALVGIGSLSIKPTEAERAETSNPRDPGDVFRVDKGQYCGNRQGRVMLAT